MKKIIATLFIAMFTIATVGCSGDKTTTKTTGETKTTKTDK